MQQLRTSVGVRSARECHKAIHNRIELVHRNLQLHLDAWSRVIWVRDAKKPVYERGQERRAVKRVMPYFARSANKASQGVQRESNRYVCSQAFVLPPAEGEEYESRHLID